MAKTHLELPGASGSYAHASGVTAVTDDLDIRWFGALDEWASGSTQQVFSHFTTGDRAWAMHFSAAGGLFLLISLDGSALESANIANPTPNGDGRDDGYRITREAATGDVTFYQADDPTNPHTTWTQIGTGSTTAGNLFASTTDVEVGARDEGVSAAAAGRFNHAELRNGIGGPVVAKAAFQDQDPGATKFTDPQGNKWFVSGDGLLVENYLAARLPTVTQDPSSHPGVVGKISLGF